MTEIQWRMLVDATTETKARKTYQRVLNALGREATLDGLAPYPGLPLTREGFALSFRVDLGDVSWAEAVLETLSLAQRIGYGWVITGNMSDTFDGVSTDFRVPGCVSIQFQLGRPTKPGPRAGAP